MYVVRRAFRNLGQMMAPGSVVEPAAIKRFRSRLAEGRIVEVNEQNFEKWFEYFSIRANVTIKLPEEPKPEEPKPEEPKPEEPKPEEPKPEEPEEPVTAKPVVKVILK